MAKRKTYSAEFKMEALRLLETSGRSASEIERELGIGDGCFLQWKRKRLKDGVHAFPGQGRMTPEQERIRQLERELAITRQERDIPKKAIAIFAHEKR
jgi:transposase